MSERALTAPSRAWTDWRESFRRAYVWIHLGFNDLKVRYRRSVIGPWWITIQTAVTLFFLGFVYSQLFGVALAQYLPYLTVGMIFWYFASATLSEGCAALVETGPMLQQLPVPVPSVFLRVLLRNVLVFLHNAGLIVVVLLIFGLPSASAACLFVPGFLLFFANIAWMAFLLGLACLRFRDIQQMLVAVLNLLMLLTPIFWNAATLPRRIAFVEYNPFYHLLEIVRMPLLGEIPGADHWIWAVALAILGWGVTLAVYGRTHRRLTLWV